jgi:hypothetical protein
MKELYCFFCFGSGCGIGGQVKYLAGYYERYISMDYSEELIKAAKIFNLNNPNAVCLYASSNEKNQLQYKI